MIQLEILMPNKKPFIKPGKTLSAAEAEMYLGPDFMNLFRQQLLLVCVNRLGGSVEIPVSEVDGTGAYMMGVETDTQNGKFILKVTKKQ
jgi:hypothetical protein